MKETFGERVWRLRAERGWTQEDLGKRIGVTRCQVSQIESGATESTSRRLARMADAFGVTMDWLYRGEEAS